MAITNPAPKAREITTEPRTSDKVFRKIVSVVALSAFAILALIGTFLAIRGFETFKSQGWHFITGYEWEVIQDDAGNITAKFGIGAMLVGTILIAMVALAVGVPLSILTALFVTFYAPDRIKKFLVAVVDLMAAFPSILYGLWGYFV
ncbi:MAG: PstC family ABC transporter permease, partial [Candidatus Nanopelagicaceae bacterium]